ncbi:hypothetical protein IGI46_002802 [Enterococcus sp. AZ163]
MCNVSNEKKIAIKAARRELFMLTDDEINPEWDKDPANIKRRDELLDIIERLKNGPVEHNSYQRYFDRRPGLEDRVLGLLRSGATGLEINAAVGVSIPRQIAYLRRKYRLPGRNQGRTEEKAMTNFVESYR